MQFSLNLTVHNKDSLLIECIERIKKFTTGQYELIVVLDGCTDGSKDIVTGYPWIKVFETPDVYETKANNVAMKNSSGDYIIVIQDDMLINEHAWNERLLKPILAFDDIFAVTARCSHNWEYNPNNRNEKVIGTGWSDILNHTDHAQKGTIDRNTFGVRDCVNRGPLLIRHDVLNALNYLDEIFSPQEMDDHDLSFRARESGWRCGCYWIDYLCENNWGGTRENGITKQWLLDANQKNARIIWERHKQQILIPKFNENRSLPE